jgi:hypothetical protein
MAGAVAGISAAWAAIGSFGGVIIGTAIQGAIIGAAIGGLSAAVMGGDIGKGMLFGGVGGAVMGGISGAFSTASSAPLASTSISMNENVATSAVQAGTNISSATAGTISTGGSKAFGIGKFFASEGGGTIGAGLVTTAGTTLAGAFDDTAEENMKLEREKMAQQDKQFYANLEAQKEIAKTRSSGGGSSYDPTGVEMAKLAEQRRQFDTTTAIEQAKRERRSAALGGLTAAKEAGVLSYEGVDTAIYNKNKPVYDEEANKGVLANA